jgi:Zn-dependent protease with chaperone function
MSKIIVSFRREDTRSVVGRIEDTLADFFGDNNVVVGIERLIDPGDDFVEAIEFAISSCNVLIVVVGEQWNSHPWMANKNDYDHLAIMTALNASITIIPVFVDGSQFPKEMPDTVAGILQRAGISIATSTIRDDLQQLVIALQKLIEPVQTVSSAAYATGVSTAGDRRMPSVLEGTKLMVLHDLDATAFQHPLDRLATENLRKLRGFDVLVSKFIEFGFERMAYYLNVSNSIRVGPRQYPTLYQMLQECCAVLSMPEPELYVQQGGVNAMTYGHSRPCVVVYTGLLDLMTDDEVRFVLAHELGHIKCGHVLYNTMANYLGAFLMGVSYLPGVGDIIKLGLQTAIQSSFLIWSRRSELSADRAGLLAVQDAAPPIAAMAKLAGGSSRFENEMSVVEFVEQARLYNETNNQIDKMFRFLAETQKTTHPYVVERAKYLNEWIDAPEYDQILQGNYMRMLEIRGGMCPNCNAVLQPGSRFCQVCGRPTGL